MSDFLTYLGRADARFVRARSGMAAGAPTASRSAARPSGRAAGRSGSTPPDGHIIEAALGHSQPCRISRLPAAADRRQRRRRAGVAAAADRGISRIARREPSEAPGRAGGDACCSAAAAEASPPAQQPQPEAIRFERAAARTPAQHGRRLARVLGCQGCHGADLQGQPWDEEADFAISFTSNLTRALPAYSDAQIERAMREGVRPDGSQLWGMPSEIFTHLDAADMAALIAYLRTLRPAGRVASPHRLRARRAARDRGGNASSRRRTGARGAGGAAGGARRAARTGALHDPGDLRRMPRPRARRPRRRARAHARPRCRRRLYARPVPAFAADRRAARRAPAAADGRGRPRPLRPPDRQARSTRSTTILSRAPGRRIERRCRSETRPGESPP